MTEDLLAFIADYKEEIDKALRRWLPLSSLPAAHRLNEAIDYAVFPGGKRLRPVLAFLSSKLAGAAQEQSLAIACAVEFLHNSSLIIDDLPGMDDADLRRNKRALHLVYGEGIALLSAIALLNQSYALLAHAAEGCNNSAAAKTLIKEATLCVGADGMVGGQVVDIQMRAGCADAETVASRDLKTVALMRLMMTAGAHACGADKKDVDALAEFGEFFGRAYQVCDDILDEFGESFITGKPSKQDLRHLRVNNVETMGIDGACRLAEELIEQGISRLSDRFNYRDEVKLLEDVASAVIHKAINLASTRYVDIRSRNFVNQAKSI